MFRTRTAGNVTYTFLDYSGVRCSFVFNFLGTIFYPPERFL